MPKKRNAKNAKNVLTNWLESMFISSLGP